MKEDFHIASELENNFKYKQFCEVIFKKLQNKETIIRLLNIIC